MQEGKEVMNWLLTGIREVFAPMIKQSALETLPDKIITLSIRVVFSFIILIVGIWFIKLFKKCIKKRLNKSKAEPGVIQFLGSFIGMCLYVVLGLLIAGMFGVDAASIVAIIGSAGVAIGLALQGSLSNLAGGVLILILKPFKVGDYIIEDNKKNEGTVTEIELFYTKLQTPDDKTIILPNGTLANTSLTNVTHTPYRKVELQFEIAYDADLKKAKEVVETVMREESVTIKDREFEVYVNELLSDGIMLGSRCVVKNENYILAKRSIMQKVKERFDENGIEIPYPQLTVRMNEK